MGIDSGGAAAFNELFAAVKEAVQTSKAFGPQLKKIENNLGQIEPIIRDWDEFNNRLDRNPNEMRPIKDLLNKGKGLVQKCSKIHRFNMPKKYTHSDKLKAFNRELMDFNLYIPLLNARNNSEMLCDVKEIGTGVKQLIPSSQEIGGALAVPDAPDFIVGSVMEASLRKLREQLLEEGVSVIVVTGPGGCGKTTLLKKLCHDNDIEGKFNIMFVPVSKKPTLTDIVWKMIQHNGFELPLIVTENDAVHCLQQLLIKIGQNPVLLVLDDVWTDSQSLIEKFIFKKIKHYKVVVTSRYGFPNFALVHHLKPLPHEEALELFRQSVTVDGKRLVAADDEIWDKIVKRCKGLPLALTVVAKSLRGKDRSFWEKELLNLSHLALDSDILDCLRKSLDDLDGNTSIKERFMDLGSFPEDLAIPATALIDMWVELYRQDFDGTLAINDLHELFCRNLADLVITRRDSNEDEDKCYSSHYAMQHSLLRELAIMECNQGDVENRKRLIVELTTNNFPDWWSKQKQPTLSARLVSISTDGRFSTPWPDLQLPEAEALVLNFETNQTKTYALPDFIEKADKLKALIVTNYSFFPAELHNFHVVGSSLRRIRLKRVMVSFQSMGKLCLHNLQKISFFMCDIGQASTSNDAKISDAMPNLKELDINYCDDLVTLPDGICEIKPLKKLSITNCHNFSTLPEQLGQLTSLEVVRLNSCTHLLQLPISIGTLQKLISLNISDCLSLSTLPSQIGQLNNLKRINMRGCVRLSVLPRSFVRLRNLKKVICDEEREVLWEPLKYNLNSLNIMVPEEEANLDWLRNSLDELDGDLLIKERFAVPVYNPGTPEINDPAFSAHGSSQVDSATPENSSLSVANNEPGPKRWKQEGENGEILAPGSRKDKSISDQPVASSVDTSLSLGLGPCSHAAADHKELKTFLEGLHTEPGYVTNKGSLLSVLKEEENATVSSEAEKLVAMQKQRAESDFVPMQSTQDTEAELFPCSHAAEDQQELKPLFGIDLLHTKAGYVTNDGSLPSDLKEEENATVSSEAEKLVAMQKQRAESDFVPMQSTPDTKTELFPQIIKKDADPHATLGKVHSYSSHSESEVGSHCLESESEETDEKMKIRASPEYHRREISESAVLQIQNTAEPEVEPFSLEVNEDTASDKVHSYSSEQESEVDSYFSGPEYEVGDKKESSSHATLDDADALIDMLGGGGKREGRPSEGWGAIKYDSIVDHLIKSIKRSNIEKIGIYGRNEVAKAIIIEALKESAILRNLFDRVIFVTVPLNCDMEKVEKEIAGQISSDLTETNAVDMPHSVVNALEGLKFLLILVGINQHMKLETLRIPEATPPVGSKIVFVTGSGQLCDEIEVDKKICLDDLLLYELFRQNVGEVVYYSKKALAREIVRMCRPYSHAVILVARALQNVDDILIWKHALERLNVRPTSHEACIEALMVNVLRFCIDQLEDDKTRRCLKNLALSNNYHEIASESAVGLWVRDGIVDAHDEGQKVLKNLVNASLLEVDENPQFVKFQDQDRDILVNLIFQREENRVFLMRGGLDLIEPPEVEEWESAKEICLMYTAISELPKEPRCPSLSSLYLQRNYKLRKLSSSFFNQMPALEVLNLSRTRIRCLPESISQLVSLKRLFLNDCVLLRSISPAIAGLKRLEVFDLEGTKIKNLPREIECLINLTCLGISISGTEPFSDSKTVIPHGVISSLLHLEELNLNVDANAEWWDTCAEGVLSEVCNLKRLSTFKFSFPTLELFRQFNQLRKSMEHPSLAQFRLCVGNHASRIMNRLPSDIEFELEQCNRFLRYTNGDGVFTDIKDILQQSDAFFLERHANLKKLSELGMDSMDQLKWCVLGECNELEVLVDASDTLHQEALTESHCKSICLESLEFLYVYYMRNLRNIWKGSMQKGCLSSLKLLTLCKCPELIVIFSSEMLDNLNNLEEVTVEDCPAIKSLITCQTSTGKVCETSYFLPILKKLSLHYVPKLSNVSCGLRIAPRLERLSFYDCPSLKSLSTDEVSSEHLKKIRGERSWWEDLKWHGHKPDHLDSIFVPIDTCDIP